MERDHTHKMNIPGNYTEIHIGPLNPVLLAREGRMVLVTTHGVSLLQKTQELVNGLIQEGQLDAGNDIIITRDGARPGHHNTYREVLEQIDRDDGTRKNIHLVVLGGESIGKVAEHIAVTYTGGVGIFTKIPTTQLAIMAGKDLELYMSRKNFPVKVASRPPDHIYIDPIWSQTLTGMEFISGLTQVILHAMAGGKDSKLFKLLYQNAYQILDKNPDTLSRMNHQNIKIIGKMLPESCEENIRIKILNYGHTIGRAIASTCNYGGLSLPYGYTLAMGMQVAVRLAIHMQNGFTDADLEILKSLLGKYRLPIMLPLEVRIDPILAFLQIEHTYLGDRGYLDDKKDMITQALLKMQNHTQSLHMLFPDKYHEKGDGGTQAQNQMTAKQLGPQVH